MAVKFVLALYCFFGITRLDLFVADGSEQCAGGFQYKEYIQLCYSPSVGSAGEECKSSPTCSCKKDGHGLVVDGLFIAPKNKYPGCNHYHIHDLLNTSCLRKEANNVKEYDKTLFTILSNISGHNSVGRSLSVDRFHFKASSNESVDSEFLVFRYLCKPAIVKEVNKTVDPMITICTNQTVRSHLVTLTLGNPEELNIPSQLSMCRCTIKPSGKGDKLSINAFDIRLQNQDGNCMDTVFDVTAGNLSTNRFHYSCKGHEALYGLQPIYTISKPHSIILTLSSVSKQSYPTALWIEIKESYTSDENLMEVSCEDFMPITADDVEGEDRDNGVNDNTDDDDDPHGDGRSGSGVNLGIIIGACVGGVLFLTLLVIVIIWIVQRRRCGRLNFSSPSCHRCCKTKKPYNPVPVTEPVYSEPGNPRPANREQYTFPLDAKVPEPTVYAEPDSGGPVFSTLPKVPPPLPESPPPSSPPPGYQHFPSLTTEEPPPKPERTLLKNKDKKERKGSESSKPVATPDEEYDHIVSTGRWKTDRDKQNNIIDGRPDGDKDNGLYNHVDKGDYSHFSVTKPAVIDNTYDVTV